MKRNISRRVIGAVRTAHCTYQKFSGAVRVTERILLIFIHRETVATPKESQQYKHKY